MPSATALLFVVFTPIPAPFGRSFARRQALCGRAAFPPCLLASQLKRPAGKLVNQDTGNRTVDEAEAGHHNAENKRVQAQLHKDDAGHIRNPDDNLIGTAFQLRIDVVRLQQVITGQMVYGEKDAHGQNGYRQNYIVQGRIRPTGTVEQQREARANHRGRQQVDLDDFPQPDSKQPENEAGLFVKRIRQQAVVTVHEQGLRLSLIHI